MMMIRKKPIVNIIIVFFIVKLEYEYHSPANDNKLKKQSNPFDDEPQDDAAVIDVDLHQNTNFNNDNNNNIYSGQNQDYTY